MKIIIACLTLLSSSFAFANDISISDPYARAVPPGQKNSAAFMVIKNSSNEVRHVVRAESNIAKIVEMHTHIKDNGMMRMRQVDKITIPANGETTLKPGGLHVMLMGLHKDLNDGDDVSVTLVLDNGKSIAVDLKAKKMKMKMKMMKHDTQKKHH